MRLGLPYKERTHFKKMLRPIFMTDDSINANKLRYYKESTPIDKFLCEVLKCQ